MQLPWKTLTVLALTAGSAFGEDFNDAAYDGMKVLSVWVNQNAAKDRVTAVGLTYRSQDNQSPAFAHGKDASQQVSLDDGDFIKRCIMSSDGTVVNYLQLDTNSGKQVIAGTKAGNVADHREENKQIGGFTGSLVNGELTNLGFKWVNLPPPPA